MKKAMVVVIMCCMTAFIFSAATLCAREHNGELGFIRQPVSTRPQIVRPNDYITVDLDRTIHNKCSCAIRMYLEKKNGERIMLPGVTRHGSPDVVAVGGKTDADVSAYRYKALVPPETAPGLYGLFVRKGGGKDLSKNAVKVVAGFPESYSILHVSDPQVGREIDGNSEKEYTLLLDYLAEEIEKYDPAIAVITGNITSGARPGEFKRFVETVEKFDVPVLVSPGANDSLNDLSFQYFGPANYSFRFGGQLFVSLDTQLDEVLAPDDAAGRTDWLAGELAKHEDATLKALFTGRYGGGADSLVDSLKPQRIDMALTGDGRSREVVSAGVPPSVFMKTPPYANGFYRIVRIVDNSYADTVMVIPDRRSRYFIESAGTDSENKN